MLVRKLSAFLALILALCAAPVHAQQTGSIGGKVVDSGGGVLPGVTVEARGDVLPAPRVTTTGANGEYPLPALPPAITPCHSRSPACRRRRDKCRCSCKPTPWPMRRLGSGRG